MTKNTKTYRAELKADRDDRTFTATISTQGIDRDNEVLLSRGLRAGEYLKNPVVFWNHNYDVPIGRALKVVGETDRVRAVARMAERPKTHVGEWFPDTVLSLMDQSVIRGVSVGFQSVERRRPTNEDRSKFGTDVETIHSKWNLLEFSVVSIPANAEALIDAVGKGLISASSAKRYFDVDVENRPKPKRIKVYLVAPAKRAKPRVDRNALVAKAIAKKLGRFER